MFWIMNGGLQRVMSRLIKTVYFPASGSTGFTFVFEFVKMERAESWKSHPGPVHCSDNGYVRHLRAGNLWRLQVISPPVRGRSPSRGIRLHFPLTLRRLLRGHYVRKILELYLIAIINGGSCIFLISQSKRIN